jgi:hypothetical protein
MKSFGILGVAICSLLAMCAAMAAAPPVMAAETLCVKKAEGLFELQVNENECDGELVTNDSPWELITLTLAVWTVNGVEVATELNISFDIGLLLEDLKGEGAKAVAVKECSNIGDGWIGPSSLDWTSEVLTLGGVATKVLSENLVIACNTTSEEGVCPSSLVWPVNLPWETEVEKIQEDSGNFFIDLILPHPGGGNPGWEIECMGILPVVDECTSPEAVFEVKSVAGVLLGIFSEGINELAGVNLATCSIGGAGTGVVQGEGTISLAGEAGELGVK